MNLVCTYDTETTGLPVWDKPSGGDEQPHIVQLAAVLVDLETGMQHSSIDVIVKPAGWTIPGEVVELHGITTERAMDTGVQEALAVEMLLEFCQGRTRVAYNEPFDQRIVRIALKRFFDNEALPEDDPTQQSAIWRAGKAECTLKLARSIMGGRMPKLTEAHRHFLGRDFSGAHSAMADTQACIAVHRAALKYQTGAVPA